MAIKTVTNPRYADEASTIIDMTLDTDEHGVIPFSANANDVERIGRELHARALSGEFGAIAAYIRPPISTFKQQKRGEMRTAYQSAIATPITAVGARTWIPTTEFSSSLARLIARASRGKPILTNLRPETGARLLTPTLAQLEQIEDAIQAQEDAAQDRLDARLESIKAANRVDEVLAIVW